jgi:aspartate racemase
MKSIGIIGGAGPEAGALLFRKVIQIYQNKYHLYKDYNFPKILLINYPFSEMLSSETKEEIVKKEMQDAMQMLKNNHIELCAIACNTLHTFLDHRHTWEKGTFVHLIEEIEKELKKENYPSTLVICTSASRQKKLFDHLPNCFYIEKEKQKQLDQIIEEILKHKYDKNISEKIYHLLQQTSATHLLLGCTEFSVLHHDYPIAGKVVDPLWILAEKLADLSYQK